MNVVNVLEWFVVVLSGFGLGFGLHQWTERRHQRSIHKRDRVAIHLSERYTRLREQRCYKRAQDRARLREFMFSLAGLHGPDAVEELAKLLKEIDSAPAETSKAAAE